MKGPLRACLQMQPGKSQGNGKRQIFWALGRALEDKKE